MILWAEPPMFWKLVLFQFPAEVAAYLPGRDLRRGGQSSLHLPRSWSAHLGQFLYVLQWGGVEWKKEEIWRNLKYLIEYTSMRSRIT